ncbi:MAG: hypothetical protein M5R40_06905 [Anaerolineae bacterium]|nr:hypothetical protein [Anaerolineae bacterium]
MARGLLDHVDGAYFVSLAAIADPNLVGSTLAQTLGIRELGVKTALESLKEHLREKRVLLVLDNFEQVVEAAPLVAELLESCLYLKVMATSRMPLRVRGEREFPVPPLALAAPDCNLAAEFVAQVPSATLFVQRAQDVKRDFVLTDENAPAIAEICARLDGLPLAIELAAAQAKLLSPQAMLARLERRLPLLTGGARNMPHRQQTMRNTIEWSYSLLDTHAAKLFRWLAVFLGGCSVEAAEAVCNADGAFGADLLLEMGGLVDKNLLHCIEGLDGGAALLDVAGDP